MGFDKTLQEDKAWKTEQQDPIKQDPFDGGMLMASRILTWEVTGLSEAESREVGSSWFGKALLPSLEFKFIDTWLV